LVMTFTRAATRELSDRIRQRLIDAARCFRGDTDATPDPFLEELIASYAVGTARRQAAHRLAPAADGMDDAGIFTIDAWCQRMLREHAFDSGCLFDEELASSEQAMLRDAVRDYWRHHVYALDAVALARLRACWSDLHALEHAIGALVARAGLFADTVQEPLGTLIARVQPEQFALATALKDGWMARCDRMEDWIATHRAALNGNKLRAQTVANFFIAVRQWCATDDLHPDSGFEACREKLDPAFLASICKDNAVVPPDDFGQVAVLHQALRAIEPLEHLFMRHAAATIAARIVELKQQRRQFGFTDMLVRLRDAMEGANGAALRTRMAAQFPVALIDEFQDTSPDQYRIFDLLYQVAANQPLTGLFLIGDPKQAIYGFRGADIHSYLAARRTTVGRHYRLDTNFRSTDAVVRAVNHLFLHAEGQGTQLGHTRGAFRFRDGQDNALPFHPVSAKGRKECFVGAAGPHPALTMWCNSVDGLNADAYRRYFADVCADTIVGLLNDPQAGFREGTQLTRVQPADMAILVRDRHEAAAVREALQRRGVASVYLSDSDSVFASEEAADLLRWLRAVADPMDGNTARAAFATRTAGLSLATLLELATDDLAWEARVEQLKALRLVWQRHGILAMLRRFIHELALPAALLQQAGGERRLTNMLHLSEMLQVASEQLDGEQALLRWLTEQIEQDTGGGDERVLRLESDAELVKVVTVHKSKGLEYPLVFVPFSVSAREVTRRHRSFFEFTDADGKRQIDFTMAQASRDACDDARLDEDVRLLYVALTRTRHALWMGITSLDDKIHQSAFGYLLGGGSKVAAAGLSAALGAMCSACEHIRVEESSGAVPTTRLALRTPAAVLGAAPQYEGVFERHWGIASYTSITQDLKTANVPATAIEEQLLDATDVVDTRDLAATQDAPWHRFPRGTLPGQFLHGQLQWMADEGFAAVLEDDFDTTLGVRCTRAGWGKRKDDAAAWLRQVATTVLPPIGCTLATLAQPQAEMEFWLAVNQLDVAQLDRLCHAHLLEGQARPALQPRQLQGMLRGFIDLVFEVDGRYWILDYKSNALANNDSGYHAQTLVQGMAAHRYDV
ncbi:MAG: exodeoxyribonuclease V subunit beta, partial [Frankiaceae bacterium]|nr:exodeoxyribonuclease V subunit beta [Arenimonas sp.]